MFSAKRKEVPEIKLHVFNLLVSANALDNFFVILVKDQRNCENEYNIDGNYKISALHFVSKLYEDFQTGFNSVPNNKFIEWSQSKAIQDNKLNVTENLKFVMGRVENLVGKGQTLVTSIFPFFLPYF